MGQFYYSIDINNWGSSTQGVPEGATRKTKEEYDEWYENNIINRPIVGSMLEEEE